MGLIDNKFLLFGGKGGSFPVALINIILLALAVGLIASVVTFLIWHHVEKTKPLIRLKYYLIG